MKPGGRCHVVVLPLRVDAREAAILRQRLRVRGQLRNAALQTMLARSERMRADPRWAAAAGLSGAAKSRRYRELRDEYGLSKREACNAAFGHWRSSKWMPTVVDSRVALELGTEVWQQVSAWLHGKGGRPRFRPAAETETAWGADNQAGLCLRGSQVVWRNSLTPRKNLALRIACDPGQWGKRVAGREVVCVGIRREQVRGRERWFCLLCLKGDPYRDPDYLARVRSDALVGIDAGPSRLALVSADASAILTLCPEELLAARRREQQRLRRRQRALAPRGGRRTRAASMSGAAGRKDARRSSARGATGASLAASGQRNARPGFTAGARRRCSRASS
jgi:hypothetical protein